MSLAADGEDRNRLQLEKLRLNFSRCLISVRLQIIDINDRSLFAVCGLRLYLPLDVQRKCYEWIKLATTNFQDRLGQNSAKSPDVAPLNFIFKTVFVFAFFFFFWHKSRSPRIPLITLRVNPSFELL